MRKSLMVLILCFWGTAKSYSKIIEGSFLQLGGWHDEDEILKWGSKEWDMEFKYMKDIGMDELIIQWTVQEYRRPTHPFDVLADSSYYLSTYFPSRLGNFDLIDTILHVADARNMKVYLGLAGEWHMYSEIVTDPLLRAQLRGYADTCIKIANELVTKGYTSHPSFQGWYIPYEISNWWGWSIQARTEILDTLGNYWKQIVTTCHSLTPLNPVFISPYFFAEDLSTFSQWCDTFALRCKNWGLDAVAFMDCIGSRLCPLNKLQDYFTRISTAFANKVPLWSDLELFQNIQVDTFTLGIPSAFEDTVEQQLIIESPLVDKIICFEFNYFMSPIRILWPSVDSLIDFSYQYRLRAPKLYDDYKKHFWGIQNLAYKGSYEYDPSRLPNSQYSDSTGYELIDTIIPPPMQAYWADYVGWSGTDSIIVKFNLGSIDTIRNVRAYFLQNTTSGIYLPESVKVLISDNDTDYYLIGTADGFRPALSMVSGVPYSWIDSVYSGRWVKLIIFPEAGWTFLSEVQVFGNGFILKSLSDLRADAISYNKIVLHWQDNSALNTDYEIQYQPEGGVWQSVLAGGDFEIDTITVPTPSVKYYLRVRAINTKGDFSAWADTSEYAIPMWSYDSTATSYNNGRKVAVKDSVIYMIWEKGGKVWFSETGNQGLNWTEDFALSDGKSPALTVDEAGIIYITWTDGQRVFYRYREPTVIWSTVDSSVSYAPVETPSIAIDEKDSVHLVWKGFDSGEHKIYYAKFLYNSPDFSPDTIIDASSVDILHSPCIALGPAPYERPYVVWERSGRIYYRNYNGQGWISMTEIGVGICPSVERHSKYLSVVWERSGEIYHRRGAIGWSVINGMVEGIIGWSSPTNVSQSSSFISKYPVIVGGTHIVWQEEYYPPSQVDPTYFQVYHASWNSNGWRIQPLVCNDVNDYFPQVALQLIPPDSVILHYVYTEGNQVPYQIKHDTKRVGLLLLSSGHIAENTTWDRYVFVTGDVVVDSGVTLTINPGVTVYFMPNQDDQRGGVDTNRCELIVKGKIIAQGGIVNGDTLRVKFTSADSIPNPGDWYGIVVNSSGVGELRSCEIMNAKYGIFTDGMVLVANNIITEDSVGVFINANGNLVNLGNLKNADTTDDGGNKIHTNIAWNVYNATLDTIFAQGNYWAVYDSIEIDAKIYDDNENSACGPVDFTGFWRPGAKWVQATPNAGWRGRTMHTSVVFDNKMWLIGGGTGYQYANDVWYSMDGATWIQATANAAWPTRYGHTSVVFDNKMWVIGGYDYPAGDIHYNDIWYSTNGVSWTRATANAQWSARQRHTSVIFNNKMWVIGGYSAGPTYYRDVWYSTNGVTWTQATANAGWTARAGHTSVVVDNKMWVIGGGTGSRTNDVWYSTDGVSWAYATTNAAWKNRWNHTSVVTPDNKMWVLGGDVGISLKDDIWCSTDGVSWAYATTNAQWEARKNPTSVMHQNKIWVIGGWTTVRTNDVWYSDLSFGSLSQSRGSSWEATVRGAVQGEALARDFVFKLYNPSPNPCGQFSIISYELPVKTKVSLKIYDISGRCVKTLVDREKEPGYYKVSVEAEDLSTGIYFAKFEACNYKEVKKLILVK